MLDQFELVPDVDLDVMRPEQRLSDLTAGLVRGLARPCPHSGPTGCSSRETRRRRSAARSQPSTKGSTSHTSRPGCEAVTTTRPSRRRRTGVSSPAWRRFTSARPSGVRRTFAGKVSPGTRLVTGNTVIDALHWAVRARAVPRSSDPTCARAPHPADLAPTREPGGSNPRSLRRGAGHRQARGHRDRVPRTPQSRRPRCRGSRARRGRGSARLRAARLPPTRPGPGYVRPRAHRLGRAAGGGPALGKPVLVLRDTTERPEAVEAGVARLVGTDPRAIVDAASELLDNPFAYEAMAHPENPFGDGEARCRIVTALVDWHELRRAA